MIKKVIIILLVLLLTGCWDYRELNDLAILGSLSIDIVDEEYIVGAQIMNPQKEGNSTNGSSGSTGAPIVVYKFKGKTIQEAIRKMTTESPKKIYAGHISMLMVSEKAAKKGFKDIADFLIRDHETRKQFKVVIIRNEEVDKSLSILSQLEALPTQENLDSLKAASNYNGNVTTIGFDEFLSLGYSIGIEPVLPYADLKGDIEAGKKKENTQQTTPISSIIYKGIAVFKNDRLLGYLDEKDSIGFNFIHNNLKSSSIPFKCDEDNYAAVEIINYKTDLKVDIKDNKPIVKLNVTGEAHQSEINCDIDMESLSGRNFIKDLMNKEIIKLISSSIDTVKNKFNSDIFGFEQYLYRHNYKYWEKNKKKWPELFKNIQYEIKTNLVLTKKGSALKSIKGMEHE